MSDEVRGLLSLSIDHAEGIANVQRIGKQDPYYVLFLGALTNSSSKRRSETHEAGGVTPHWKPTFTLAWVVRDERSVWVQLWDANPVKDTQIAEGNISIRDLLAAQDKPMPFRLVRDGQAGGTIFIRSHFVPAKNEEELRKLESALQRRDETLRIALEATASRHAEEKKFQDTLAHKQRVAAEEKKKLEAQQAVYKKADEERIEAEKEDERRAKHATEQHAASEKAFVRHPHHLVEQECVNEGGAYVCNVCKERVVGRTFFCPGDYYYECPKCYPTHSGRPN